MEILKEIFSMPLFPHLYMIPITFVLGIMVGMGLKNASDEGEELLPPKPKIAQEDPKTPSKHDMMDS